MYKELILLKDDVSTVKKMMTELNVEELTAKVLCHRGIKTVEEAKIFLNPDKQKFNDPFLMKGMIEAVKRIKLAISNQEKIIIYGDYDVDGMTATSLLVRALKKLTVQVDFYIPKREEGYGLNPNAIQRLIDEGTKLLITVDCGITNQKEIYQFKSKLDFIVTDHHLPTEPFKNVIVIDPHQVDCKYPDKNLCGVGVAFKICQALNDNYQNYLEDIDLVALGTVADIVPLIGENRKIVYHGLKAMSQTKNIGLKELINVAEITGQELNTNHLGFKIGPRLNAAGRLASASTGVKLLISEDKVEAVELAKELDEENSRRKFLENETVIEAEREYRRLREIHGGELNSIVVASDKWNAGVVGLAASRLLERHYLPTIVLSKQGEYSRASCRSIRALHMKETLDHFKKYFIQYGGHSAAAGFTIKTKDIDKFREEFDKYVKEKLNDEDFTPIQYVDAFIEPYEFTLKNADEIEMIAPFGVENPQPIFGCKNVKTESAKVMGKEQNHLSFIIKGAEEVKAISWNGAKYESLIGNEKLDIIYERKRNEYNGNFNFQCIVKTIMPSKNKFPNYDIMVEIYKFLKMNSTKKFSELLSLKRKFSAYAFMVAVQVFEELGLIQFKGEEYNMPKSQRKFELKESRLWRNNNE